MANLRFRQWSQLRRLCHLTRAIAAWGGGLAMILAVGSLGLTGCRIVPWPSQGTSTLPTEPPTSPTAGEAETPTTAVTPTPGPRPQPTATPHQGPTLPATLVKRWEPLSNVLLTFGPMTVTAGEIQWGSGQSSPYTLISTEDGFLLRLESVPQFYDTANPYIKLMPKTDAAGAVTTVEVAFYEGEAQMKKDEYIMYGSYFAN